MCVITEASGFIKVPLYTMIRYNLDRPEDAVLKATETNVRSFGFCLTLVIVRLSYSLVFLSPSQRARSLKTRTSYIVCTKSQICSFRYILCISRKYVISTRTHCRSRAQVRRFDYNPLCVSFFPFSCVISFANHKTGTKERQRARLNSEKYIPIQSNTVEDACFATIGRVFVAPGERFPGMFQS